MMEDIALAVAAKAAYDLVKASIPQVGRFFAKMRKREYGISVQLEAKGQSSITASPGGEKLEDRMEGGFELAKQGLWNEAWKEWEEVAQSMEEEASAAAWYEAAASVHENGGPERLARKGYQEVRRLCHGKKTAHQKGLLALACANEGVMEANGGSMEEAIKLAESSERSWGTMSSAAHNCGNIYLRAGKPDKAVRSYERAVRLDPENGGAHVGKGDALLEMDIPAEAIKEYRIGLSIEPGRKQGWNGLGLCFARIHQNERALECFEKSVECDPSDAKSWNNQAWGHANMGHEDEARRCFITAIELARTSGDKELAKKIEEGWRAWHKGHVAPSPEEEWVELFHPP